MGVCWPLFPDCYGVRNHLTPNLVRGAVLAYIATGLAAAALFVPYFFPGDTSISGEGRLFALYMFDAKVQCEGGATLTTPLGARSHASLTGGATRSRCDPIVIAANAEQLGRLLAERGDQSRLDVAIDAKRTTDTNMQPLVHVDDFCHQKIAYSVWRHNDWIGR